MGGDGGAPERAAGGGVNPHGATVELGSSWQIGNGGAVVLMSAVAYGGLSNGRGRATGETVHRRLVPALGS